MRRFAVSLATVSLLLALGMGHIAVSAENAASWPRFNGPNEDNISSDTGLATQWPEGGPPLVWTAKDLGEGFAGVTIADGLVYTAGNIGRKMVITVLDTNGQMRWQVANGEAYKKSYPGSRGTPTLDGDRLYHESPTGNVICLNAKTGKPIWNLSLAKKFDGKEPRWGYAESVLVDGDHLICCPGAVKTAVVALDKRTGETVWQSPSAQGDLAGYASPTLVEYQGVRMIVTMTEKSVIGVNADNGELLFQHPHPTRWEVNALMPVFHDGRVFLSSGYGTSAAVMLKLNVSGGKVNAEKVWSSKDLDNHHGGVVVIDGYIYGAGHESGKGKWVCLDWETGKTVWATEGIGKGSLTSANGLLFTMNEDRGVGLVKATPEKYVLLSQFEIPKGGKGKSWAHPVVCGGRLYIRHGNFLYAYDVRGR